jgi:hypothetical protein
MDRNATAVLDESLPGSAIPLFAMAQGKNAQIQIESESSTVEQEIGIIEAEVKELALV